MVPAGSEPDELIPTIGYIRVSMAREEMISPELQRTAIIQWAKRTDHRVIDWVEDLDKTGRNFKRKIMRVIERIEAGEAKDIAVWKYSRFGRTRTGVPANLARVEKAGGQLLSATEEVDARTAIGRFQRGMIMEFNAFESDRSGEQWKETHQWRRDQGLPATGGKRFGYIWHPRKLYAPDGTVTPQQEFYEPDPELRDVLIDLYERYISGTGFYALAGHLNENGILSPRGILWSHASLRNYLDSGFPAGYLRIHDDKCKTLPYKSTCPNHVLFRHPTKQHTAIISDELWKKYQQRREFTKTAAPKARSPKHAFAGLVRCGLCGAAACRISESRTRRGRVTSHPKSAPHFLCDALKRQGAIACVGFGSVHYSTVETAVLKWLEGLADEIDQASRQATAAEGRPAQKPQFAKRKATAEAEVERLGKAIVKHMRVYSLSEADDPDGTLEEEYLATLAALRAEKAEAVKFAASLAEPTAEDEAVAQLAAAGPVALGLLEEWDTLESTAINALLRPLMRAFLGEGGAISIVPAWETGQK